MSYELKEVHLNNEAGEPIQLLGVDIFCGGSRVVGLVGGLSLMITTQASTLAYNENVRQAFLQGIVLTMSHCVITGSIPTVVDK